MVSIIVPIYNSQEYLHKCLNSILRQSYRNFELILVDDGSKDDSGKILDDYKSRDSRIIVIHKPNGGVSSARNAGLEVAQGKYILFIDSDDYVEENYVQTMLENENGDWLFSGIIDFANNRGETPFVFPNRIFNLNDEQDYFTFITLGLFNAPFPKLYQASIIKHYAIRFNTEISFAEDREFNLCYMQYVNQIRTLSYIGYHYRGDTPGSLAKTAKRNQVVHDCEQWDLEKENIVQRNFKAMDCFLYTKLFTVLYDSLIRFGNNALLDVLPYYFEIIKEKEKYIQAPYWLKWFFIKKQYNLLIFINRITQFI